MRRQLFLWGGLVFAATLAAGVLLPRGVTSGERYVRAAYDTSRVRTELARSAVFSDSASSPLVRLLARRLLSRDTPVVIDRVGSCGALYHWYEALNRELALLPDPLERRFRALRPLLLYREPEGRCFSYTVQYEVPLPAPALWRRRLLTHLPLRLSVIHPRGDAPLLRRAR